MQHEGSRRSRTKPHDTSPTSPSTCQKSRTGTQLGRAQRPTLLRCKSTNFLLYSIVLLTATAGYEGAPTRRTDCGCPGRPPRLAREEDRRTSSASREGRSRAEGQANRSERQLWRGEEQKRFMIHGSVSLVRSAEPMGCVQVLGLP
jgi:hypothetical protein